MAQCNLDTLLEDACENQFKQAAQDPTMFYALVMQLLCNIDASGGGGGGGGEAGSGSPQGVVTADPGTTYLDVDSGGFWAKQTGVGTNTGWLQLIA